MAFDEVRFPVGVALRSQVSVERRTIVVFGDAGGEERNTPWANSRRPYQAGTGIKDLDDLHSVMSFFEERRARLHGFRWVDAGDCKSCAPLQTAAHTDQALGSGTGSQTEFPLLKTYGATRPWTRYIRKPVAGTVLIGLDGANQSSGWTVDTTTGVVTFSTPPGAGVAVTAGYEFDVPVRFDTDRIEVDLEDFKAGQAPNIPLLELPDIEIAP